jgi:hypothetical protein
MFRRHFLSLLTQTPFSWLLLRPKRATADQENLVWGTYGKNPTYPMKLRWTTLGECSSEHLLAILKTQPQLTPAYTAAIQTILRDR